MQNVFLKKQAVSCQSKFPFEADEVEKGNLLWEFTNIGAHGEFNIKTLDKGKN